MPPAVAIGALAVGAAIGGYASYKGAQAQARAAERASRTGANAAILSAEIAADASRENSRLMAHTQQEIADQQEKLLRLQMDQSKRLATREELRVVIGDAATDTFQKVSSTFLQWTQARDISEESDWAAKSGIAYEEPPKQYTDWELSHTDLLTGETRDDSERYRLMSDQERQIEREAEQFDRDVDATLGAEPPPTPPNPFDGPIEMPEDVQDQVEEAQGRAEDEFDQFKREVGK